MPYTPSEKEQEYFVRQELERLKKMREEHRQKVEAEERQRLKDLHWMHCPKCGAEMASVHIRGVEVELCPGCGGLFMDAGELDQAVEMASRGGLGAGLGAFRRWWKG